MMGGKRRGGGGGGAQQEKVRTHLFFKREQPQTTNKRKRRTHNKLQVTQHNKKDEIAQGTGHLSHRMPGLNSAGELDPTEWTGNQRVLHFGPMAQRDPYFYYYPKGWDVLYPATFGFFPYRTTRFRGSHSMVCLCAFGVFLILGGGLMVVLGYFTLYDSPFWTWDEESRKRPPPIQLIGPVLLVVGVIMLIISCICTLASSNFFKMYLHHTRKHDEPSRVTTITTTFKDPEPYFEKDPYQPLPPPAYPVLENKYAHSSIVRPHDELKLYPPVIPGCSTLSLHGRSPSNIFVASPYNTLRAVSVHRMQSAAFPSEGGAVVENRRTTSRTGSVSASRRASQASDKRSKSMGPLHRSGSNKSHRQRDRENSQF